MGLFSSSPSPSSPPQSQSPAQPQSPPPHSPPAATPSPDGAFEAPTRETRLRCWRARDHFFACLERHGIIDGIGEKGRAGQVCGDEGRGFEGACAASWVTYFMQRRVMEHKKAQTLAQLAREGARPLPGDEGKPPL